MLNLSHAEKLVVAMAQLRDSSAEETHDQPIYFERKVEVEVGDLPVTIIADDEVPDDYAIQTLDEVAIKSDGSAWTTGTNLKLQDSNGSPVEFMTLITANLPDSSNPISLKHGIGTVTAENGLATGGTAGKGLDLIQNGTYAGAAKLTFFVSGIMRRTSNDTP